MSNLKNITADIVVAVAQGLKPLNLAEYYKAKELIIFDINPLALQFQKKLFSIASPTIYGEVVEEFLNEHPDITVAGNWRQDYYCIVKPVPNLNIRYEVVDAISFEMENFLRTINHERSAVFDFSDIFIYPFNFYHKNLLQVKALFTEIYSQIKSRSGPTHIMGFAPDFKGMHLDEINTSRISYELDPNLPPMDDDVELTQEMLDMDEYIESKSDVIVDANDPPKPSFDDALVHQYVKTSKIEKLTDRYVEVTIYSKIEKLQDFDAIFEYIVYPDNKWDFKVGKVGLDKRVSFMLGPDLKTFLNHLNKQLKINPKTAVKHFIGN